jgi:hypothetical protein
MPPQTRRSRIGEACQSSATVEMPARVEFQGRSSAMRRQVVSNAGEHVGEVVLRIETVELGAFDQRIGRGGAVAAGI